MLNTTPSDYALVAAFAGKSFPQPGQMVTVHYTGIDLVVLGLARY